MLENIITTVSAMQCFWSLQSVIVLTSVFCQELESALEVMQVGIGNLTLQLACGLHYLQCQPFVASAQCNVTDLLRVHNAMSQI